MPYKQCKNIKSNKLIKWPLGGSFSPAISWTSHRLCYPFVRAGHIYIYISSFFMQTLSHWNVHLYLDPPLLGKDMKHGQESLEESMHSAKGETEKKKNTEQGNIPILSFSEFNNFSYMVHRRFFVSFQQRNRTKINFISLLTIWTNLKFLFSYFCWLQL